MIPSNDSQKPHYLIGENVPTWFVLVLALVGIIGIATTTKLLPPPDLIAETLKSWATQSNLEQYAPKPPPLVGATTRSSTATTPQNPSANPASPIIAAPQSRQISAEIEQEDASTPHPSATDGPVPIESTTTVDERAALVVDESIGTIDAKGESEPSLVAPEVSDEPMPPMPDQASAVRLNQESSSLRVLETVKSELEAMPAPATRDTTIVSTDVDPPAHETSETITRSEIQSITDEARDCAPLFFVQFERADIYPVDVDLNKKVTKLRSWLSRHPEAVVLIEGHADSSGPEEINLLISHRRAKAVSELLANAGIAHEQMATRAFGEQSPLPGLPSESETNRRVSLRIEGTRACSDSDGDV